nr:hypothetical protein [Neorhizobium galegae]
MQPEPQTSAEIDTQWEIEAVLAWHDDDAKAAIATLLEDNRHLRKQLALAEFAGSRGFARGWRPAYERIAGDPKTP